LDVAAAAVEEEVYLERILEAARCRAELVLRQEGTTNDTSEEEVVTGAAAAATPMGVWKVLHRELLTPQLDFAWHETLYEMVYAGETIAPCYVPSSESSNSQTATNTNTHLEEFMTELNLKSYPELYQYSITHRNEFWWRSAQRMGIQWKNMPTHAILPNTTTSTTPTKEELQQQQQQQQEVYFPNGRLNITDSCFPSSSLERTKHNNEPAIVFADMDYRTTTTVTVIKKQSEQVLQTWTWQELEDCTNRVANAIHTAGWSSSSSSIPGTPIAICMPMTPESIAIYLGIVRAGCVVVSIPDSFSTPEIETRCRIAKVQAMFTQDVLVRPVHTHHHHHNKNKHDDSSTTTAVKIIDLYQRVLGAIEKQKNHGNGHGVDGENHCPEEPEDEKECKLDDDEAASITMGNIPIVVLPSHLHYHVDDDHPESSSVRTTLRSIDYTWDDFLKDADTQFESVIVDSMAPSNILFSSGTTGEPKAIVWNHVTPIKCAVDGYFHHDFHADDIVAWPTNIGWMMGPWLVYQLIHRVTLALYLGLPHTQEFCQFVERAQVTMLGVVPSLVQTWKTHHTTRNVDWSRIRRFSSTGEASDPSTYLWLSSRVPGYAPIIEYCGGTEIGGAFLTSTVLQPNVPSMFSTPALGSELRLLDPETQTILPESSFVSDGCSNNTPQSFNDDPEKDDDFHHPNTKSVVGELVLIPPSVGWSTRLLNRNHYDCYFEGMPTFQNKQLRRHGDAMELVRPCGENQNLLAPYFRALGRCDDTMNLGGIKVSSAEIERVCNTLDNIQETAAIAVPASKHPSCSTGGPCRLVVYVVLKQPPSTDTDATAVKNELRKAMQLSIKNSLNPLFAISDVILTPSLPRTASNKVMRRLLRDEYIEKQSQP
jgi:acetyl-CoA synthetase